MFLPNLVEYIQNVFELPRDLPMVYNTKIPTDDVDGDDDNDGDDTAMDDGGDPSGQSSYSILQLDSPLSQNSDVTKMDIEVVGIYPNANTEKDSSTISLPTMAMLVVKKKTSFQDATKTNGGNLMMDRMFQDSESKILRALEMGFEDFMDGRVRVTAAASTSSTLGSGSSKATSASVNGIEMDTSGEEWSPLENLDVYEGFNENDGMMEDLLITSSGKSLDGAGSSSKTKERTQQDAIDVVVSDAVEMPTGGTSPMLQNLSNGGGKSFLYKASTPGTFKKRNKVFDGSIAEKASLGTGSEACFLILHGDILLQENASNYLLLASLEDEMNEFRDKMRLTARQSQLISNIAELAKTMKTHPGNVINPFFKRLEEKEHLNGFMEGLEAFVQKLIKRAVVKRKEIDAERAREEGVDLNDIPREERLGPGGLDPVEVFESLPPSMQDAFESRNTDLLKKAFSEMSEEDAEMYLKKCIDSGTIGWKIYSLYIFQ